MSEKTEADGRSDAVSLAVIYRAASGGFGAGLMVIGLAVPGRETLAIAGAIVVSAVTALLTWKEIAHGKRL